MILFENLHRSRYTFQILAKGNFLKIPLVLVVPGVNTK